MTPGTESLWAELPGDSKIDLHRSVTFYELENAMDVLFRGKTPTFTERSGYGI